MSDKSDLLKQIDQQLDGVQDFGQIQIYVKKHSGAYSNVDVVKMSNYRYTAQEKEIANGDCAADIYSLMKGLQEAEATGTLGFSIQLKKGKADLMQVQDFKKL